MVYPTIYRVSTIQGGAGFLPSTVVQRCTKCCDVTRVSACHWSLRRRFWGPSRSNGQCSTGCSPEPFLSPPKGWEIQGKHPKNRPMMTNVSRKKSDSWFLAKNLAAFFYVLGRVFQLRKNDAQRLWSFPDLIPCFIGTQLFDPETNLWTPTKK
jgi:hypothetical protein